MRLAIVVGLLLLAITSQHSGPEFVTHDCTRAQLSPFIAVSSALCRLASDRRLSAVADRGYPPQPQRSPSTVLVALLLLLLLGGIELNPSPSASPSSCVGLLNARSACHKAALIHDVIADNKLHILLLTEIRFRLTLRTPPSSTLRRQTTLSFTVTARRPPSAVMAVLPSFTATPSGQHRSTSATTASSSHSL